MMKLGVSIVAGVAFASFCGIATAAAADLTVGAFGGVWEKSLRECAIAPFEAATGKTVEVVLGAPVQWMNQITASPDDPPLDVIFLPSDNAYEVVERGLVQKFTPEHVPNLSQLTPYFAEIGGGYGVVHNYGAMGIIYNKETVKEPPKSWAEFIEGTLEGKWLAAMPSINYPGALSVNIWNFSRLRGGDVNNIEPGIAIIKEMQGSGNLDFWVDPNQVLNGLQSGEFDLAMYWDGRAWAFIDEGNTEKFGYVNPEPGSVAAMTWIQVVKNADPLAWEFVNSTLSKEVQGCFGSRIRYGVGNADAKFDQAVEHEITKFDQLSFPPFVEINKLQSSWIETWNKEIGR
jgi:putative spermidine/putrescine transport system substrate-binding protein